jgi:hypothetical protein
LSRASPKNKFESPEAPLVFSNAEKAELQGRDSLDARKWRPARRVGSCIRRELAPQHLQRAARLICFLHHGKSLLDWSMAHVCKVHTNSSDQFITNHQSPITNPHQRRDSSRRGGSFSFLNWFKNDCFCTALGTKEKVIFKTWTLSPGFTTSSSGGVVTSHTKC